MRITPPRFRVAFIRQFRT